LASYNLLDLPGDFHRIVPVQLRWNDGTVAVGGKAHKGHQLAQQRLLRPYINGLFLGGNGDLLIILLDGLLVDQYLFPQQVTVDVLVIAGNADLADAFLGDAAGGDIGKGAV